jgi:hypothetical protein
MEELKAQIRGLMRELAHNGVRLRIVQKRGSLNDACNLMCVRVELLKSIAHRQGLLIEALENEMSFSERKVA